MKRIILTIVILLIVFANEASAKWEQRSHEAVALLTYMEQNVGVKMLSGAMANVNYNTNEADWVYKHTGKYPALNCFDYIHAPFSSTGGWIDYGNPAIALGWSDAGGIVAAMWHWNMKANNGTDWSFNCGTEATQTSFSPSDIFYPTSEGYQKMISDIDQVAEWMKPLAQQHIPILWRPLHEAQGNWSEQYPNVSWHRAWFWWGADGPAAFVQLWKVMYDRMVNHHGLTNLIWVFTTGDSKQWYPGDEYVDIVGYDFYNHDINSMKSLYQMMKSNYPGKLLAVTECGNIPKISEQWAAGLYWSYFMPWYDYNRTNNPSSPNFNSTEHQNCNIAFWQDALACDFMLTRDELPDFTSGIATPLTENADKGDNRVYDMLGRPVTTYPDMPSRRGIYILNGQKFVVR